MSLCNFMVFMPCWRSSSQLSCGGSRRVNGFWLVVLLQTQLPVTHVGAVLPSTVQPGPAVAVEDADVYILKNRVLEARISIVNGVLQPVHLVNLITGHRLPAPAYAFEVRAADGSTISNNDFHVTDVNLSRIEPEDKASQLSRREGGWSISCLLLADALEVMWSAELRNDANAAKIAMRIQSRQSIKASMSLFSELSEVCLLSGILKGGEVAGTVEGVPIVSEDFFLGVEHPKGKNSWMENNYYKCCLNVGQTIAMQVWQNSLALGVVVPGQIRRSFLHYLERERAHPSRRMLHYNTWYDIGTGQQFTAAQAQSRLQHISREMALRGVVLDAFLLDDGWDDPDQGPWDPHSGFSVKELEGLEATARRLKTGLGVWFSPFGGYHEPRQRRIAAAKRAGIPIREEVRKRIGASLRAKECSETSPCSEGEGKCRSNNDCKGQLECWHTSSPSSQVSPPGIDMSTVQETDVDVCFDPGVRSAYLGLGIDEYFSHFQNVLLTWIARGARLLKLDGIGNPAGISETLEEDFDSAVALIAEIRKISSDIFINLSTGTWPSPFWLLHSDTVWRRGHDHFFEGAVGPARERWINYRDAMVYQNVVKESPLFPLNSLMIHGIIFAQDAWDLNVAEGASKDRAGINRVDGGGGSRDPFKHEVRSAFGSGAMLQELYVTPALLESDNWDDLAEAALWASSCVETMVDVQWFGGDPAKGAIYGWVAWSNERAILTLRNPAPTLQIVQLEPVNVFNLPKHVVAHLQLNAPFPDQRPRQIFLNKWQQTTLEMPPFAVYVFDSGAAPPSVLAVYSDILWNIWSAGAGPAVFWTSLLVSATWLFSRSRHEASPVNAVPIQELRRRRLQALERGSFNT